jgi:hypothetical protein
VEKLSVSVHAGMEMWIVRWIKEIADISFSVRGCGDRFRGE